MFWFGKKTRKRPEKLRVPKITFVCEQDGIPEKELKQSFVPFFQERDYIHSAYLARVTYGNPDEISVSLCIQMDREDDETLRKTIGNTFAVKFNQKEYLDIIFISSTQEEDLRRVCRPFYEKK